MKKTFLVITILLLSFNLYSQNLHPLGLRNKTLRDYSFVKKADFSTVKSIPPFVDHTSNIPPVGNQGSIGSCVGWASGYYYKTYQEYEDYGWSVFDQNHIFSPSFVYNHINGGADYGADFGDAFKLLMDNGCTTIKEMPYGNIYNWPSEQIYKNALKYRSDEFFYIDASSPTGIQQLKQHVADGHCSVLGIAVYPNFDNIASYNYNYAVADIYGDIRGYHAVTIIGYDDNRPTHDGLGAFKLVNSWGLGWGANGFFWMSYTAVMNNMLSGREGYYTTDKIHYNPQLIANMKISHSSRYKINIKMAIGANCSPLWTKYFFNFSMGWIHDIPFPNNKIVFDLTDGIQYIYANTDNRIYTVCKDLVIDGMYGMIDSLSATNLNWGLTANSIETPIKIFDDTSNTFAGVSLGPNLTANVGVVSIDMDEYIIPGATTPKATIRNCGTQVQSFPVTFEIFQNSGNKKSVVFTSTQNISNLLPNTNLQVSFSSWNSTIGSYSFRAYTQLGNDSLRSNDSLNKEVTILNLPVTPVQVSPANGSSGLEIDQYIKWRKVNGASRYFLQVSTDPQFSSYVVSDSLLTDTVRYFYLNTLTKYYWKIKSVNQVGSSAFSEVWNFKAKGMPSVPGLISPLNNSSNLQIPVTFRWHRSFELTDVNEPIEKYLVEFTKDTVAMNNYFVRIPVDTLWSEDSLLAGSIYYWRVSAKSNIGWGQKSAWWKFSTASTGIINIGGNIPSSYNLYNNYPNPFNPATSIRFDIPKESFVTLKVYDVSGREISDLLNSKMDAGSYKINFNAVSLSSGIYFFRLKTADFISTKKMILLK
jgi:C1A family cysteine protease